MKKIMTYLFIGFIVMFLFTFISGMYDDAYTRLYHTGVWYKDIVGSFKYYFLWVLPYWWLIIIIGTIVLALLFYGINIGVQKLRQAK